jgi:hypothetical protein
MDKLSLMFDAKQFAAAFGAARYDSSAARSGQGVMMWLKGGVGLARAGVAWGQGQINYQGRNQLFRVSSLSTPDAGVAGVYATGQVIGLSKISDFSGSYRASSAGGAMAGGGLATNLQNERGVVIQLVAVDTATAANQSINAVQVRLKHV